jgi:hypothetical protein
MDKYTSELRADELGISLSIYITRRMLRYAPRFHRKKLEKNRQKKIKQKKFTKKISQNFP